MCIYFIGQPEQFVPTSCYFRLVGEREGVWRQMARPADYVARRYLYSNYGRNVAEVMRRPCWIFDNDPSDDPPDIDARLVDGLLCGLVIYDRFRSVYPPDYDKPEDLRYVVRTIDYYFELSYRRPANERSAYFVSQAIWTPPEGWQNHAMAYKRNHSWWHVHTDDYDAAEDDHYFQKFISRSAAMAMPL